MRKSQQFGFLLIELLCAISLFVIAMTAAGGLLSTVLQAEKRLERQRELSQAASSWLETGVVPAGVRFEEVARLPVAGQPFFVVTSKLSLCATGQAFTLVRCQR